MTSVAATSSPTAGALWRLVDAEASPERLAMLRWLTGGFVVAYLVLRLPVFVDLGQRRGGFDGVGLAAVLGGPVGAHVVGVVLAATLATGISYTIGWRYRITGPMFALGVLVLTSYRSSWGQLLHFENLFAIHLVIVSLSPAADRWSLDARAGRTGRRPRDATAYGWPIALAALVVVITYVIAGVAKLRYGGTAWLVGDALRHHIAYSAARLDLLGGQPSPLASWAVSTAWLWPFAAAASVVVELAAPLAMLGGRIRTAWVVSAWLMHAGILLFMLVGFPYPLFLVAFAPFFELERLGERVVAVRRR